MREIRTMSRFSLISGDITTLQVDAIVNAANESLLGGGGVDGAIHDAAGPGLLAECRSLGGCRPGDAKITAGYDLPAQWIIHTVGPVWRGGAHGEEDVLRRCYRSCAGIAKDRALSSIAFPSISTGAFRYPLLPAARVAIAELHDALRTNTELSVIVVCFESEVLRAYKRALSEAHGAGQ